VVEFLQTNFLFSPELGKSLHENYHTLESNIKKQIPDTQLT